MRDANGKVTYNLLSGAGYVKDNRLLPAGFNKVNARADVAVAGNALDDSNFTGGSDQVSYQIKLSGQGPYTVTARLLYQSVSYQFSRSFNGSNALISSFVAAFNKADKTPMVAASVTKTVG
jgi:hypothetical protein